MRRKSYPSFLALAWVALYFADIGASGMTAVELQQEIAANEKVTVIDIRTPTFFARGHIPGAINVPASLCLQKKLPPLGKVVVCAEGLGRDVTDNAVSALAAKPGLSVQMLDGGFAAWESAHLQTSKPKGLEPEVPNYITYAQLKAAKTEDIILVDLRSESKPVAKLVAGVASSTNVPLTDLNQEFPGMRERKSAFDLPQSRQSVAGGSATPLLVLIDNGDGKAQAMARTLKANGLKRYVILAGGEMILARKGQPGLQRGSHGSLALRKTTTTTNAPAH